jgi:ribosomal protein S18 acetylase RimI-like enzyme
MTMLIREYQEADLEAVVALQRSLQEHVAALDTYGLNRSGDQFDDRIYTLDMLRKAKDGNGFVLVAEQEDGLLVGLLATTDTDVPLYHFPHKQGSIEELVVSNIVRGKGIGSLLMQEAEKRYKAKGYEFLNVICFTPNVHAHRFYEKCGFEDRYTNLMKKIS